MTKMTKNEYKKFVEECANRYWKEDGYTWDNYNKDCDSVEILPPDLSKFEQLTTETKKWINILFTEEDEDGRKNFMMRGFTRNEWMEMQKLGLSYGDYGRDGLSFWAYNNTEYLIYTYCEGDTTLTILPDKESYEKEYNHTLNWYKEEYA